MTWTQKEIGLLKDLQTQEALCVEKYGSYADRAHDGELKNLFSSIRQTEQGHLNTISDMLNGGGCNCGCNIPSCDCGSSGTCQVSAEELSSDSSPSTSQDRFLCQDALSMEKHVSSLYDVSVFEFSDQASRDTLNRIQGEEQHHGKQLYDYMSSHGMM